MLWCYEIVYAHYFFKNGYLEHFFKSPCLIGDTYLIITFSLTRVYPDITFWLFSLVTKVLHNVNRMSESQTDRKNVWMSDKSWEPEHSHSLSHFHTLTLSLFHSLIHSLLTCWTTFVFMSMLKSHSLTFTLSHSRTLTLSHSLIQSLSTCWTSFVFMSMLKTRCLLLKIAMIFLQPQPHPPLLL